MRSMRYEVKVPDAEGRAALERILQLSYAMPTISWTTFFARVGHENLRTLVSGDRVLGGLAMYRLGQFFGGKSVPLAGVAGVGIAPEARGRGLARDMLRQSLEQARAHAPLAGLYASTTTLYRACGFEQAGTAMWFSAPLASFPRGDRSLACEALPPKTHAPLHAAYEKRARTWTGHLDRTPAIWERIVEPYDDPAYAYVVGNGTVDGYVAFQQKPGESIHFRVLVRDLVMNTRAAAERILSLLFDLRSLAQEISWRGCAADPLLSLLPEQTHTIKRHERWMLRILDVERALALRGYPPVSTEVHLAVRDDLFPENAGPWVLRVTDGRAEVARGGRGEVDLDVRALAAMYTGFATVHSMRAAGLLDDRGDQAHLLELLFAGPEPWCCDHY